MKKVDSILKKCKSMSKLGRSSSYSSLRSKSTREELRSEMTGEEQPEVVYVGRSRRRYMLKSKHLSHPLINALIEKSKYKTGAITVNCEVVLFDHLLWMLENADLNLTADSLEELAELYAY